MRRALKRFSLEEIQLRRERPYFPAFFEKEFGYDRPAAVGSVPVRGRIDRIDVSADGKTAIVVDYKSSKTFFVRRIAKGLELQMPVYWMVTEQLLGLRVAGVEHRHLKDGEKPERRGREEYAAVFGKSVWSEEKVQEVLGNARAAAEEAVRAIRAADIAVRPKTCDHCDYSPVCRFEKWKLIYEKPLD
jgi:ATP-dependent helicase/DNAse subunit B